MLRVFGTGLVDNWFYVFGSEEKHARLELHASEFEVDCISFVLTLRILQFEQDRDHIFFLIFVVLCLLGLPVEASDLLLEIPVLFGKVIGGLELV